MKSPDTPEWASQLSAEAARATISAPATGASFSSTTRPRSTTPRPTEVSGRNARYTQADSFQPR